jgi:hypothetical protein
MYKIFLASRTTSLNTVTTIIVLVMTLVVKKSRNMPLLFWALPGSGELDGCDLFSKWVSGSNIFSIWYV